MLLLISEEVGYLREQPNSSDPSRQSSFPSQRSVSEKHSLDDPFKHLTIPNGHEVCVFDSIHPIR